MKKLKVLVVEDEIIIADNICRTLQSLGYEVFEPVLNFSEAIESIEKEKPDIAILDIHLAGAKTGIDLARKINHSYNFPFIFLTANADISVVNNVKKVAPQAYLIKPFSKNELYTSIEIAVHNFSKSRNSVIQGKTKNSFFVKDRNTLKKVFFNEITFIKSAHIYIEIHLKNQNSIITRISLNEIKEKLNSDFIRVQRGYIVNVNHITEIRQNHLQVSDITIPIGLKYKENLYKKLEESQ